MICNEKRRLLHPCWFGALLLTAAAACDLSGSGGGGPPVDPGPDPLPEPVGGAHRDADAAAATLRAALIRHLDALSGVSRAERVERRLRKFRGMGVFSGGAA